MEKQFNFIEACDIAKNNPEKVVVRVAIPERKLVPINYGVEMLIKEICDEQVCYFGISYSDTQAMWKIKEEE